MIVIVCNCINKYLFYIPFISFETVVITRDCSSKWPYVHAKSGLHKLLGADAFFCQESLYVKTILSSN